MFNLVQKIKEIVLGNEEDFNAEMEQLEKEMEQLESEQNYICLNNLYLSIERGEVVLNTHLGIVLRTLVMKAYDSNSFMIDWWAGEFRKLDGWLNV